MYLVMKNASWALAVVVAVASFTDASAKAVDATSGEEGVSTKKEVERQLRSFDGLLRGSDVVEDVQIEEGGTEGGGSDRILQASSAETIKKKKKKRARPANPTYVQAIDPIADDPVDVVVIGAGWAGLSAAHELLAKSKDGYPKVKVLEATDYIGGRSKTEYGTIVPDEPIDIGSEWLLEPEDNSIQEVVDGLGLPAGFTEGDYVDSAFYGFDGTRLADDEVQEALVDRLWTGKGGFATVMLDLTCDLWGAEGQDVSVQQVLNDYVANDAEVGQSNLYRQFLNAMVNSEFVSEYAMDAEDGSVADAGWDAGTGGYDATYMPVRGGGFTRTVEAFAAPFRDLIQTDSVVERVDYTGDVSQVIYEDRTTNTKRVVEASAVLVTVPLGALRAGSIAFDPPLPDLKQKAIDEDIGWGNLAKCILHWDIPRSDVFWPLEKDWVFLLTEDDDTSYKWTLFLNQIRQGGEKPVLIGYSGGTDADAVQFQTDAEVVEDCMSNLRIMYGQTIPAPDNTYITRWKEHEFFQGAYSYPRWDINNNGEGRNSQEDVRRNLKETVPDSNGNRRVWFAGEATNRWWYATVNGAFDEGVEAATDILKSLK